MIVYLLKISSSWNPKPWYYLLLFQAAARSNLSSSQSRHLESQTISQLSEMSQSTHLDRWADSPLPASSVSESSPKSTSSTASSLGSAPDSAIAADREALARQVEKLR